MRIFPPIIAGFITIAVLTFAIISSASFVDKPIVFQTFLIVFVILHAVATSIIILEFFYFFQ